MKFEDLTLCAFRYSLGRRSYIVSEMVDHLLENWDKINNHYQKLIIQETEWAIDKGCAGDDMDVNTWKKLLYNTKDVKYIPMHDYVVHTGKKD